ncbi:MAG: calcium:proton antiporter [Telluria sp.]
MKSTVTIPPWSIAAPTAAWLLLAASALGAGRYLGPLLTPLLAIALLAGVLAAVFHAEVVAHRVGEPFGTLVLAVAVTAIEVALIVSLMIAGGAPTAGLARDTVYAAVMIILNGMVGICLLAGGQRHHEQAFGLYGTSAALATLAAISVLTMVLPNYTTSAPGAAYSAGQLGFIALVSVVLYGAFVFMQTVRHRDYFLPPGSTADEHAPPPSVAVAWSSLGLLVACLAGVVLLAKALAPVLEAAVADAGAPQAVVGVIIAAVVLLPESIAAFNAARANRLQTSLNLALGSALASIGLTIPAVAIVALVSGRTLLLGIDGKATVLLMLSLIVATLSLGTGRTTVMQGVIHFVIFAAYLFTTVVP